MIFQNADSICKKLPEFASYKYIYFSKCIAKLPPVQVCHGNLFNPFKGKNVGPVYFIGSWYRRLYMETRGARLPKFEDRGINWE